ncbi:MAG TPA: phosphate ABC transporter permease subunit PstC, partial [Rudaea sp.]|nr:phosphate ABC transporter permease subunit PstC [Rudaea sp.]
MTDTVTPSNAFITAPVDLAARARRDASAERLFKGLVAAAGWLVLIVLIGATLSMLWGGRDAFATFGWNFLTSSEWDPVQHKF